MYPSNATNQALAQEGAYYSPFLNGADQANRAGSANQDLGNQSSPTIAYPRGNATVDVSPAPNYRLQETSSHPAQAGMSKAGERRPEHKATAGMGGQEEPTHQPNCPGSNGHGKEEEDDDFDLSAPDLDSLGADKFARYLVRVGVKQEQAECMYQQGWTGRQWVTVLEPNGDPAATKATWELLEIEGAILRLRLMADIKEAHGR